MEYLAGVFTGLLIGLFWMMTIGTDNSVVSEEKIEPELLIEVTPEGNDTTYIYKLKR